MTETWSHWCLYQDLVALPVHTPKCPDCGALDLKRARVITPGVGDTEAAQ
jgi:hypothetical protein